MLFRSDIANKLSDALNNMLLYKNLQQSETALRDAKEELECQYEELEELDKMKDGLLSDVTHELKTPVSKQWMQVELLKRFLDGKGLLDDCGKIVKTMEATIARQNSVINNILDLSRLEKGGRKYKFESIHLDTLLREVLNDYQPIIESHGVAVETELPKITINSDSEMLSHVFANLINNAIKYKNHNVPPKLGLSIEVQPRTVIVKITDNGIGISKSEQERVFERFYQASASAPGSGVGLTIAKIIVEDLAGQIWLESAGKDQGTTVFVELPLIVNRKD